MVVVFYAPTTDLIIEDERTASISISRSGYSPKIRIKIIAQRRDGSMYLPAVQEVPYLNRNKTIVS